VRARRSEWNQRTKGAAEGCACKSWVFAP
jgi:hypothetical protein